MADPKGDMQAGKLRQRVSLQSVAWNRNTYAEPVATWTTYATRWAEVLDLSGRELQQAQQVNAEVSVGVNIRWMDGVEPSHRVIFGSRTLEIVSVRDPENLGVKLQLLCVESPDAE